MGTSLRRILRNKDRGRQLRFSFVDRAVRLERTFKRSILAVTLAVAGALVAGLPAGRYAAGWLASQTLQLASRSVGVSPSRSTIDGDWRRRRQFDISNAQRKFRNAFDAMQPPLQRLFRLGGLDPDHVVLRWGNFDRTLLLSSQLFERDESGRSYRMKPRSRSIWVRALRSVPEVPSFLLVPETPGLHDALRTANSVKIAGSNQITNSWGLRGEEPDLSASLRGIVLGDSYMQGILVADDETPSACLRRDLEARLKTRAEVINTGHIGYSPEQCYFTLLEYADRIAPQFVVLSLFANDFGELFNVIDGHADWDEGRYWIGQIQAYCRGRGLICLAVPAPFVSQVESARHAGSYPGQVSNIAGEDSMEYLDPIEAFVDEQLVQLIAAKQKGDMLHPSPLFNGRIGDGHFSPLGSMVWAEAVGRRLSLLLEARGVVVQPGDHRPPYGRESVFLGGPAR